MVFNATLRNISAISWLSVLLMEETGIPGGCDWYYLMNHHFSYLIQMTSVRPPKLLMISKLLFIYTNRYFRNFASESDQ
jgi:hypothetical protein